MKPQKQTNKQTNKQAITKMVVFCFDLLKDGVVVGKTVSLINNVHIMMLWFNSVLGLNSIFFRFWVG